MDKANDGDRPAPQTSWGPTIFRLGAISNWLVTGGTVLFPKLGADLIGLEGIQYLYLMRIWAGMAFLWGVMFWEIARDLDGHKPMIKYAWLEKLVTATSVTIAFSIGEVGWRCFGLILFTDYLWIPFFLYYDMRTRGNPMPATALAQARLTLGLESA